MYSEQHMTGRDKKVTDALGTTHAIALEIN
jgi:hypothetical protein